jgi:hypothetical protein
MAASIACTVQYSVIKENNAIGINYIVPKMCTLPDSNKPQNANWGNMHLAGVRILYRKGLDCSHHWAAAH